MGRPVLGVELVTGGWVRSTPWRPGAVIVGVALACAVGCKKKEAAPVTPDLPALIVTESTEGVLLTWIDDKGDFHVEQKTADVPLAGRDAVRVVDPSRDEGTHDDRILVADLRVARADGTFPVTPMKRSDFDALALARREKQGPTMATKGPAPSGSVPAEANGGSAAPNGLSGSDTNMAGRPAVIIYGASWCSACHDAAAYLRRKGIAFVEKDIEADARAAQEMKGKLARTGLPSGSIPVLDVRGRVMVGFNASEVDAALGQAL